MSFATCYLLKYSLVTCILNPAILVQRINFFCFYTLRSPPLPCLSTVQLNFFSNSLFPLVSSDSFLFHRTHCPWLPDAAFVSCFLCVSLCILNFLSTFYCFLFCMPRFACTMFNIRFQFGLCLWQMWDFSVSTIS